MKRTKKRAVAGIALALGLIIPQVAPTITYANVVDSSTVKLRILETSDIHTNLLNYNYFQDAPDETIGLAKVATLIKTAKSESKNTLLFDNGDLIQGTPLGDYMALKKGLKEGDVHPSIKALNLLNYDAATLGNHEFNFGLDFLKEAYDDAKFPVVNANVYKDDHDNNPNNDQNYFTPYTIQEREVTDDNGQKHTIKVGVIGFVPPDILKWDKDKLEGQVITKDIVKSAEKFIPKMKAEGADIIVALAHTGISTAPYQEGMEDAGYYLTKVPGIDAILTGHAHKNFPALPNAKAPDYTGDGIDNVKGTINGIPVTMPGSFGNLMGQIDLTLELKDGKWSVTNSASELKPITGVQADPAIADAIKEEHEGTLNYVRSEVGTTTAPINSYFALVQDDPSIQIVTNAQKWYVEKTLKGTANANLPILSAGAPFKAGGRGGAGYYTDIAQGPIAIKNVADLYLYPNTVYAVKVNGADLKDWLEWSAGQFNQVDLKNAEVQDLVNIDFPTYNFDVIDGVTYEIDVTQPAKYDKDQKVVNANASRIKNLKYNGKPVTTNQEFIVATNNYRANGLSLAKSKEIVLASPDESRQAIIDYIALTKTINPTADNNWTFAPINGSEGVKVSFETSPNAQKYVKPDGNISYVNTLDTGFAQYELTIPSLKEENQPPKEDSKPQTPKKTVIWKGAELKKGQIGLVTITKNINLWKREGNKLVFVRVLKAGEIYRVYNYDGKHGGQYAVGGGHYITNMKGYVKYETPSKAKLAEVNK